MKDWDEHRLILALYRGGSLRAAADHLGVTHTTVSRRLTTLEEAQPTPIFIRSGRSLQLSDYGRSRLSIAEQIETLDLQAERLLRGSDGDLSGPVSLSVPQAFLQYLMLEPLAAFCTAHPHIELSLLGSDSLADLDRGEADVVLRGQTNPDPHLVGRKISTVGLNYYATRSYLNSTPETARRWITSGANTDWIAASPVPSAPVGMVIDDIVGRHKAVAEGHGMGRLACFMSDPNPNMVRLGQAPSIQPYELWILTHPDLRHTPKIKALMGWVFDALKPQRDLLTGVRTEGE